MTQFKNVPELDSSLDWCYFDMPNNYNHFVPDYTFITNAAQLISDVVKMISMTKFNRSFATRWWFCILKKELASQLSLGIWFKKANAYFEGHARLWADWKLEIIQILEYKNIGNGTLEDKNTFIQLLIQEFPNKFCDVIIDKKANAELSSLKQKKDEDLYICYCWTKSLLKKIYDQDEITYNKRDIVTFSPLKQQLLNDTIIKFILSFKNYDL